MKTKVVSQRVEDDGTPCSPVGFEISPDMTPGEDHVAGLDAEHVEEKVIDLITARRTKKNPQKMGCEEA